MFDNFTFNIEKVFYIEKVDCQYYGTIMFGLKVTEYWQFNKCLQLATLNIFCYRNSMIILCVKLLIRVEQLLEVENLLGSIHCADFVTVVSIFVIHWKAIVARTLQVALRSCNKNQFISNRGSCSYTSAGKYWMITGILTASMYFQTIAIS